MSVKRPSWLLCAENALAPICRKRNGLYVVKNDKGPFGQTEGRNNPIIAKHFECTTSLGVRSAKPI
jgi:hypothetical protein